MMYVTKAVLGWIIVLCCWRGTEGKYKLFMENRIRLALTGQTLTFNLSVNVPENHTFRTPECYHQSKAVVWDKMLKLTQNVQSSKMLLGELKMRNVNCSGNYFCRYERQEVHWVVLVRDAGYEDPRSDVVDAGIIVQMCVSGILLIFNMAATVYISKSYKKQFPAKDGRNKVTEQRPEDDAVMDEDEASASLYTALQGRTGSIYDTIHPENQQDTKSQQKDCTPHHEDEIFDSVYENL